MKTMGENLLHVLDSLPGVQNAMAGGQELWLWSGEDEKEFLDLEDSAVKTYFNQRVYVSSGMCGS